MEPSHLLIDIIFQMSEDNQLKYVRWDQCAKRDQELMGVKSDPTWKPDSSGIIREVKVQEELKADVSSDLKLKYALQRRSLAFDQARLVDFDKFERWSQILLEAYTASPPTGFKKVSIEQVHHADMEMFKYLMKETRNGIRPVGAVCPLEDALTKALTALLRYACTCSHCREGRLREPLTMICLTLPKSPETALAAQMRMRSSDARLPTWKGS